MLTLNNITFEFGSRALYQDADWHIKPGERIGLIGANGTGKSTLLRIINGEYQLSAGSISKHKDLSIGFFNQDLLSIQVSDSILSVAMSAFSRQLQLQHEIDEILKQMEHDHSDKILQRLSDRQSEFEHLDGYRIQAKAEEILEGLGFSSKSLHKPYTEFSGGWRMRVMLAKLILQQPDLLMLDEPTNHLDLPSIQWLEEYLQNYEGTVIIVSHDRYFLDRMVSKIAEIDYQKITLYPGNYSFYLENKAEREELQQNQYENQQRKLREQERFIERFRSKASKATVVQSRIKMLEKVERIEEVKKSGKKVNFNFTFSTKSGRVVTEFEQVSKAYGDLEIVKNASLKIERGDKIAFIGANGLGKSTMLRIIAGTEPHEGQVQIGYNVKMAFFAQHQLESLNLENNLLQELQDHVPLKTENELRTVLGCFLFTGEDVFKKIKILSGGEKSRVALAKVLLSDANFLLLDEPSNHLDMQSVNILIEALQDYEGSMIFVSHDRYFISETANKIWFIENHELKEYPGTYHEYEQWQARRLADKQEQKPVPKAKPAAEPQLKVAEDEKSQKRKALKKLSTEFALLEENMSKLQEEKASKEMLFSDPEVNANGEKLRLLQEEYKGLDNQLQKLNVEYEKIFNDIVALETFLQQHP